MNRNITRKEFLTRSSKTALAVSAGALGANVLSASGEQRGQAGSVDRASALWPLPYRPLDPEDARRRGHKGYYDGGCCYGAFVAVLDPLAEQFGAPYTNVPGQMMYYGAGGGAGWGTLCGAINGAAAAISLFLDRGNATNVVSELFGWYTTVLFPSDISNDYAQRHLFLVNRYDKPLLQTVSGSTLCHASVSKWCTEAGVKASAPDRSERCARLTADTSAKAVDMLNAFVDGQFRAVFIPPKSVTGCMGCHGSAIANVQATVKMDCQQCHQDNWEHLY